MRRFSSSHRRLATLGNQHLLFPRLSSCGLSSAAAAAPAAPATTTTSWPFHRSLASTCLLPSPYPDVLNNLSTTTATTRHGNRFSYQPRPRLFSSAAALPNSTGQDDDKEEHDFEPQVYAYRHVLKRWYNVNHEIILKDGYDSEPLEQDESIKLVWTANFTCPVTKESVGAGKLPGMATLYCSQHNGKWYYRKKKYALEAAAMEALRTFGGLVGECNPTPRSQLNILFMRRFKTAVRDDCFQIQETNVKNSKVFGGAWWTATFICPVSGKHFDAAALYRRKRDALHSASNLALHFYQEPVESCAIEGSESMMDTDALEVDIDVSTEAVSSREPHDELLEWYRKRHTIEIPNEQFVVSSEGGDDGHAWFTASFVCPINATRYDASELHAIEGSYRFDEDNGLHWYRSSQHAIQAAAMRALDMMDMRQSGQTEPRYCVDLPSTYSNEIDEPTGSGDNIGDHSKTPDVHEAVTMEEEDEYIIEVVPQRIGVERFDERPAVGASTYCTTTTLDMIADTWIESTVRPPFLESEGRALSFRTLEKKREKAIDKVTTWIEQQEGNEVTRVEEKALRTQFDDNGLQTIRMTANLMLDSLAASHQRLPFSSHHFDVESAAFAMLSHMWSRGQASTQPDSNTLAAYIRCLEGETPLSVARRAKEIFDAMDSGSEWNGRALPKPNVNAFNAMLQRQAEAGIKTPVESLNRFCNRETLLICLSSVAHSANQINRRDCFDSSYSQDIVAHMRTLALEDNNFLPTVEALKAPVPWCAGALHEVSRPYSRCVTWENYATIFKDGFRDLDTTSQLWIDAMAIEEWYDRGLANLPVGGNERDIEVIEGMIQAWIRTGMREGVERAEQLALSVIEEESGLEVRLQTFHPILAAWTFSGTRAGCTKVDSWMQKLQSLLPSSVSDSRLRMLPLLSRVAAQRSCGKHDTNDTEYHESLSSIPAECSLHLDNLFETAAIEDEDGAALVQAFMATLQAWHNSALEETKLGNAVDIHSTIETMRSTLNLYDRTLASAYHGEQGTHSGELFLQLVHAAPKLYGSVLVSLLLLDDALRDMESSSASDVRNKMFHNQLHWVEEKVRRSLELQNAYGRLPVTLGPVLERENASKAPSDGFVYEPKVLLDLPTNILSWDDFYGFVGRMLDRSWSQLGTNSDLIRVALLLARMEMDRSRESSTVPIAKLTALPLLKSMRADKASRRLLNQAVRDFEDALANSVGRSQKEPKGESRISQGNTGSLDSYVDSKTVEQQLRRRRAPNRGRRRGARPPMRKGSGRTSKRQNVLQARG